MPSRNPSEEAVVVLQEEEMESVVIVFGTKTNVTRLSTSNWEVFHRISLFNRDTLLYWQANHSIHSSSSAGDGGGRWVGATARKLLCCVMHLDVRFRDHSGK